MSVSLSKYISAYITASEERGEGKMKTRGQHTRRKYIGLDLTVDLMMHLMVDLMGYLIVHLMVHLIVHLMMHFIVDSMVDLMVD